MREAHQNVYFHLDGDQPIGVSLGFDWCAEHEWGISGIKALLSVPNPDFPLGVEDRLAKPSGQALDCIRFDTFSARMASAPGSAKKTFTLPGARLLVTESLIDAYCMSNPRYLERIAIPKRPFMYFNFGRQGEHDRLCVDGFVDLSGMRSSDPLVQSKWDKSEFELVVWGQKRVAALKSIHSALVSGDLTVSVGASSNPFGRGGLHLMVLSKLSEEFKAGVLMRDKQYKESKQKAA